MGYWISEDDEDTFESKEEMVEYAINNESYFDYDEFYRWLDDRYCASDILMNNEEEFEYIDEYDEWRIDYDVPDATEGEPYEYGDFVFDWVDEDDEDDEDDDEEEEGEE